MHNPTIKFVILHLASVTFCKNIMHGLKFYQENFCVALFLKEFHGVGKQFCGRVHRCEDPFCVVNFNHIFSKSC
jgi:hypothetical protein